ncbi:probable H/ACA ribonucleoprotein complex subunit 4 [Palaemon carinicauda]|uniref:probable H/ACA ribonucleoprotein complex subunit 4 n=1 Tax=Palaemon carinicauda TaxID=392227 RepID=UPI0035B5B541
MYECDDEAKVDSPEPDWNPYDDGVYDKSRDMFEQLFEADSDNYPDSIVWTAPRTPFRSPMRQDEEFSGWFASRGSLLTPPAPSVALPPDFMQSVTLVAQLQAPMLVEEDSGALDSSSSSSSSSDDTSSSSSSSSEDSSDREMRKKKKKSKRKKSSLNSGPSRKKAKVAKRKSKKKSSKKKSSKKKRAKLGKVVFPPYGSNRALAAPVPASAAAGAATIPLPSVSSAPSALRMLPLAH